MKKQYAITGVSEGGGANGHGGGNRKDPKVLTYKMIKCPCS